MHGVGDQIAAYTAPMAAQSKLDGGIRHSRRLRRGVLHLLGKLASYNRESDVTSIVLNEEEVDTSEPTATQRRPYTANKQGEIADGWKPSDTEARKA